MASRFPARVVKQAARSYARRNFSSCSSLLEAQNFTMPAMSPTMTEGNISSWKVKEGDSFSTGDVLLEIETDKASMDVEAQDDGIVAKIFVEDGSKGIKVGTRIAVLAEVGDDLASLKIPEDTSSAVESQAENVERADEKPTSSASYGSSEDGAIIGTPQNKRPSRDRPLTSPVGAGQNPKYPLYPSVLALIHQNHIPDDEVKNIAATGPNNRLLKGDVLAYLGNIEADYSKKQSERIEHNSHLDLSNIKVAPTAPKPSTPTTEQAAAPATPQETTISIPISLAEVLKVQKRIQETLNVSMPLSTFLARAVDYANDDLPKPKGSKATQDELFNAVLGLNNVTTTSRGTYLPQIDALPSASVSRLGLSGSKSKSSKPDIMDILSGSVKPRSIPAKLRTASTAIPSLGATNVFTVTVPVGEEKRARTFLERMKTILQVEPGRLVL
jgi:hypothetical protein